MKYELKHLITRQNLARSKNPSFLVIVSIDFDRNLLFISVSLSPTIIVFRLLLENATHDRYVDKTYCLMVVGVVA